MPKQKDDTNIWLVGAGILATVIGAVGTFVLSNGNNSGSKKGNTSIQPKKAGCGCGAKH